MVSSSYTKPTGRFNRRGIPVNYNEGKCLSTDVKPMNWANGSELLEIDTGKVYNYDEEHEEWTELKSSGGSEEGGA